MASKAVANVPASKDALLKTYRKRLKDDVAAMIANFMEIIKLYRCSCCYCRILSREFGLGVGVRAFGGSGGTLGT